MENENMIDVTEEMDVSDAVNEHESSQQPENLGTLTDEDLANSIPIRSISAKSYLLDRRGVDWEQTSRPENINTIHENQDYVYRILQDLLFTADDSSENQALAIEQALTHVKQFIEEFGIHPDYRTIFPDASDHTVSICYCIDAITILSSVLTEIAIYRAGHPVEISNMDIENNCETVQEETV